METQNNKIDFKSFDDLLFENRNKLYGAYELRTNYRSRLIRAFMITVSCLSIWFIPFSKKEKPPEENSRKNENDFIVFTDLRYSNEIKKPEVLQAAASHSKSPAGRIKDVFTVVDSIIEPEIDSISTAGQIVGDTIAGSVISQGEDSVNSPAAGSSIGYYNRDAVDKSPEFPGGLESFYKYLKKRIHYTHEAKHARLNAKMYVRFVIDEEGFIRDVKILNRIGYGLDSEVQNVLMDSPKWTPGIVRNESVKTEMVLPVSFSIQ